MGGGGSARRRRCFGMITPEELHETWNILEALSPAAGELQVREADLEVSSNHVLFGVNAQKHWHVLIPVLPGTKIAEDRHSSGVQILKHRLVDRGRLRPFVDLVCLKPHLHRLFSIIISEVLSALEINAFYPDRTCQQVLNRWRELLNEEPTRISMEKYIGLFGELWFLRKMVQYSPEIVQYWIGPEGGRYDFSIGSIAIEVKTTLSPYGRRVEIHGHRQMEPPENGKLYIVVLKLEHLPGTGESVQGLIDSIVSNGVDLHTLLILLARADVRLADLETFYDTCFQVLENRIYAVNDDFPCITSKSFTNATLPPGVIRLNYQVDLSNEPPYPLDENTVEGLYSAIASEVIK
jgi:Putative  PD-(D/E)XK family member, (DUF4420)